MQAVYKTNDYQALNASTRGNMYV